jgi:hypothetical protein
LPRRSRSFSSRHSQLNLWVWDPSTSTLWADIGDFDHVYHKRQSVCCQKLTQQSRSLATVSNQRDFFLETQTWAFWLPLGPMQIALKYAHMLFI